MEYDVYAEIIKNEIAKYVNVNIEQSDKFTLILHFYHVYKDVRINLIPYYRSGLYPINAAKIIADKAVNIIVNEYLKAN